MVELAITIGLIFSLLSYEVFGLAAGLVIGLVVGADTTIKIEGKSKTEIQEILEKLRKKARVKNAS